MFKKDIFKIIRTGSVKELEAFIAKYPEELDAPSKTEPASDWDTVFKQGITPLGYAAAMGRTEMLSALITLGAEIDKQVENGTGNTALNLAASYKKPDCVKILLASNAATNIENADGNTVRELETTLEIKKLLDPNYIAPAKQEYAFNRFIKENDHMVSYTKYAAASRLTIRKIFNFEDKTILTQIKELDGRESFETAFKNAACPERIKQAATFLTAEGGDICGWKAVPRIN